MNLIVRSVILLTLLLLINDNGKKKLIEANSGLLINLLQSTIGVNPKTIKIDKEPFVIIVLNLFSIILQETEWNFDPKVGKQRRIEYEEVNGFRGEKAIAKLGMGIGYSGPWGTPTKKEKFNK
ncbi:hypothetical protein M0802_001146 [Mischocyttarus mexicanus]|nr:hypothetical protein M0802_001146 [Mischocyttarus mexicanus]